MVYYAPVMTDNNNNKSYLLEAVQLAILMDGRSDFEIAKAVGGISVGTVANIRLSKHIPSVVVAERFYEALTGETLKDLEL